MGEPVDRSTARRPGRDGRSALTRVLANASLLAFASLCVISLATARFGAALLWSGALLVFFASALDRSDQVDSTTGRAAPARVDGLRWCGLALAAAGAALLLL